MGIRSQNNGNQITKQWESDHKTMGIRLQCLNAKNLRTMLIYGAQVGQQGGLEDSRLWGMLMDKAMVAIHNVLISHRAPIISLATSLLKSRSMYIHPGWDLFKSL